MSSKLKEKILNFLFWVGEYMWILRNIPTCFTIIKEVANGFRFCYAPTYGHNGYNT